MADTTGFSVSQRPGIIAAVAFALGIAVATIVPAHSGREIDGAKASLRFPPPPDAPGAQLHQLQLQLMQMQLQLQNLTHASPPAPSCSPLPSESRAPSASTAASPSETRAPSASAAASPSPAAAVPPSQAAGITAAAASARHCGRTWPIAGAWSRTSGTWSYRPSNCEMAPLAAAGAGEPLAQCLAGRRVFALGNSVARQFAFELPTLIHNSSRMPIEEQKVTCAKDALDVERCVIETGYRTVVRPLWFLHLNGWPGGGLEFVRPDIYLSPKRGWDGDVCGKLPTEECLRSIFGESQASDVLLFNIGIAVRPPWSQLRTRICMRLVTSFANLHMIPFPHCSTPSGTRRASTMCVCGGLMLRAPSSAQCAPPSRARLCT